MARSPAPPHSAALPFVVRRKHDAIKGHEITSTKETIHGLVRLEGERVIVQWRLARSTDRVGMEIRTDREVEPVREVVIPLRAIAGAAVRWRWGWPSGPRLVLTAADLRAFEEVAGSAGLGLDHPAELALPIRRADRELATEFAGEVELAVAERALAAAEQRAIDTSDDRALGAGPMAGVSTRAAVPDEAARRPIDD